MSGLSGTVDIRPPGAGRTLPACFVSTLPGPLSRRLCGQMAQRPRSRGCAAGPAGSMASYGRHDPGEAMSDSDNIALGQPTVGDEELAAVAEVFRSGWLAGQGPACRTFEAEFAAAVGVEHALAVNNCTAALHLALLLHDVGPGDEVIVADYTFPATGHAVLYTGATPVFADVLPDTWTVDPAAVAAAIGPRTVGIIGVDAAGLPADYAPLRELADRHGLFLVEDAACSAGATYQGGNAGTLAEIACFSFHGRKGITAGEGGALVTNDA